MKNKILILTIIILTFVIILIPLKGSYAFYSDNKNLEIINTKVGDWNNTINKLILSSYKNTPKNDTTLEPLSDVTEREDTLRRYQGSAEEVTNNYMCFGTSDKDKCTDDTDHYMYRIIGYDTISGEVKIVKKESLNHKNYQWWNDYDTDITWPNSLVYQVLNGNDFLNNENYIPKNDNEINWQNKIIDHNYLYGDMLNGGIVGEELYRIESGKKAATWNVKVDSDTPNNKSYKVNTGDYNGKIVYYVTKERIWNNAKISKISLMYISDFCLSVKKGINCSINNIDVCQNGWIFLKNNDNSHYQFDLFISRHGYKYETNYYENYYFRENNGIWTSNITFGLSIRPTFYITKDIKISGEGTITNPFVIIN